MKKNAIFFGALLMSILAVSLAVTASASLQPSLNDWTGQGAMAHWTVIDGSVTIIMNATVGQFTTGTPSFSNMIYIGVEHGASRSDNLNYTSEATWAYSGGNIHLFIRGDQLAFNGQTRSHNISVTWTLPAGFTPTPTVNYFIDKGGNTVNAVGIWSQATAKITIDGETGPHPEEYTSDWAVMGLHQETPVSTVPEVPLGTIVASAAMVTALGFFTLQKVKKSKLN